MKSNCRIEILRLLAIISSKSIIRVDNGLVNKMLDCGPNSTGLSSCEKTWSIGCVNYNMIPNYDSDLGNMVPPYLLRRSLGCIKVKI